MIKSNNNLANDEELLGVGRVTINGKRPSPLVCSMPVRNLDPKILRIVRSFKDKALFLEGGIPGPALQKAEQPSVRTGIGSICTWILLVRRHSIQPICPDRDHRSGPRLAFDSHHGKANHGKAFDSHQ